MKTFAKTIIAFILFPICFAHGKSLSPMELDSPRATMKSYLKAMSDYNEGRENQKEEFLDRINDAARTFDMSNIPVKLQGEKGRRLAKLLIEIIDRTMIIDLEKIPDNNELKNWRLRGTEIILRKQTEGDREGLYLFSHETLSRIPLFYHRVQHLPYLDEHHQGVGYKPPFYKRFFPIWFQENFLGLQKWQWIALFLTLMLGSFIKGVTRFIFKFLIQSTEKKPESLQYRIFTALHQPIGYLAPSVVYYFCFLLLGFEGLLFSTGLNIIQILISIGLIWCVYSLAEVLNISLQKLAKKTPSEFDDQLLPFFNKSLKIFIIIIGVLLSMQNLGLNVASLLAGLGLGGLAFALAAKDTAANLFGSIMIIADRPFKLGDWIVTSHGEGNVIDVGFRSTRLRTFYDSVISIPNSTLANENIDNMGKRTYRRVKTTLSVTYNTPADKLNKFIEGIKQILRNTPSVRQENFHVVFNNYGESSLNILLYFFLKVPDWTEELQQKELVFLEIHKLAENLGVSFAFPSRSLYIEKGEENSVGQDLPRL